MKFVDTKVVFREIPDEISLAINISGCPVKCPGCHSKYLQDEIGEELTYESLGDIIEKNSGISCVSFMGGDANPDKVKEFSIWIHNKYPGLKTAWYSGRTLELGKDNLCTLDFIKVGPYDDKFGPLDSETTNQRFYQIEHTPDGPVLNDWTSRFTKKNPINL